MEESCPRPASMPGGSGVDLPCRRSQLGEGGLAYVGIAPNGKRSSASIRSRVLGDHLGNAIGSSTLRRGLAAFLWEANDWTPS